MMAAIKWQDWPVALPQTGKSPVLQTPPNHMQVLRHMLQDLMSEQLLPFRVLAKQDDRISYEIVASDKEGRAIHYHCHGRLSASFWQVRLCDENIMRITPQGSRPVASLQEFLREVGPQLGICEIALARFGRDIETKLQPEQTQPQLPKRRNPSMHDVLLLEGETALPFTDLCRLDTDGEALIADWLIEHGSMRWLQALLETTLQPLLHLLYAHGIGIEADANNIVLLHKKGLPVRMALKKLPDGLHMASQFSACAGIEPRLLETCGDGQVCGECAANSLLTRFYSATMLRNFGKLSVFLREHFRIPELSFWQQVANCIYRYQDNRPGMALRFASFDLFTAEIEVESAIRCSLLDQTQALRTVRNPLHRFRRN